MADKIIFEGDINFYVDFEIPSGTEGLATIDDETAVNNVRQLADGTEVICEFTSSDNFLSGIFEKKIADEGNYHSLKFKTPIAWSYPVSSDSVFMHAGNNQIDLYSPISSLPVGEYHLKIYISGPRPKPVTYSASQNGGSIYDNLKELYSSVTGEDAKGHNPSEVIDELKGKLGGGGSNDVMVVVYTANNWENPTTPIENCSHTFEEIANAISSNKHIVAHVNFTSPGTTSMFNIQSIGSCIYYVSVSPSDDTTMHVDQLVHNEDGSMYIESYTYGSNN